MRYHLQPRNRGALDCNKTFGVLKNVTLFEPTARTFAQKEVAECV